jgi:hypothetical protein
MLLRGAAIRSWAAVFGASLVISGLLAPPVLRPLYRLWMALGRVLGQVNAWIVLGVVFFAVFTPVALLLRILKKRPILLAFDPDLKTYRIARQPRPISHMRRQF